MKNKYNRGDTVYHVTPESPAGVVLDVCYYFRSGSYSYYIAWSHNDSIWVWEEELSIDKKFS